MNRRGESATGKRAGQSTGKGERRPRMKGKEGAISSARFVPPGAGGVRGGHPEQEINRMVESRKVRGRGVRRGDHQPPRQGHPDRGSPEAVPSAQGGVDQVDTDRRRRRRGNDRPRRRLRLRGPSDPRGEVEPPPPIVAGIDSPTSAAWGKLEDKLLILLDLGKVLSAEEKHVLAGVA